MSRHPNEATPNPCINCPWLTQNQGKPHPDGWYTKTNISRLWSGMRRGERMSCHPTDPNNPISDAAKEQGQREIPDHSVVRECTGAQIMQQREFSVFQNLCEQSESDSAIVPLKDYRAQRPGGMTKEGLIAVASRLAFTMPGEVPMARPDLNQPVGLPSDKLPWPTNH